MRHSTFLLLTLLVLFGNVICDDISAGSCTSNDVRITGPGSILNPQCGCTTAFNAVVVFPIVNNAASSRLNITMHLCPLNDFVAPYNVSDVLLQNTDGTGSSILTKKQNTTMVGTIPNFPCSGGTNGLVCYGVADSFIRGSSCPAGACCSGISWLTPSGQDTGSKCRLQQICVQVKTVDLTCDSSPCDAQCGGTVTLTLCSSGFNASAFYASANTAATVVSTPVRINATCASITASGMTSDTTITGSVAEDVSPSCNRTDTQLIHVNPLPSLTSVSRTTNCTGALTFTANPSTGFDSFTWSGAGTGSCTGASCNVAFPSATDCTTCRSACVVGTKGQCSTPPLCNSYTQCITTSDATCGA